VAGSTTTTGTYLGPILPLVRPPWPPRSTRQHGLTAAKAIDGDIGSPLAGHQRGNEWIYVDLGNANVAKITKREVGLGKRVLHCILIQTCISTCSGATVDAWAWTTVSNQTGVTNGGNSPYFQSSRSPPRPLLAHIRMRVRRSATPRTGRRCTSSRCSSTLP